MSLVLDNLCLDSPHQATAAPMSLRCQAGEFTVLLGRTGSGKTRFLRTVAGLEQPLSGQLSLDGINITTTHPRQRDVAMVYQQFINYPHLSVFENIASPLRVAGIDKQEIEQRVREVAELLQISPFLERLPGALSGGQQQRCALARAMVKNARVLLFDEPLVNLDAKLREMLRVELKTILAQRGCIALYATTDPHEALALGGTTLLMDKGRILQQGSALDAFYRPVSLQAANLFHEPPLNLVHAEVRDHQAHCAVSGNVAFPLDLPDGRYLLGIRPDKVELATLPAANPAVPFPAKVTVSEVSASESFVHLDTAAGAWVVHKPGIVDLDPETTLTLYAPINQLYAFAEDGSTCLCPSHEESHG